MALQKFPLFKTIRSNCLSRICVFVVPSAVLGTDLACSNLDSLNGEALDRRSTDINNMEFIPRYQYETVQSPYEL